MTASTEWLYDPAFWEVFTDNCRWPDTAGIEARMIKSLAERTNISTDRIKKRLRSYRWSIVAELDNKTCPGNSTLN